MLERLVNRCVRITQSRIFPRNADAGFVFALRLDAVHELVPVIAGAVLAAAGPLIWVGCYKAIGAVWLPAISIGVLIGLAMRIIGQSNDNRLRVFAALFSIASCAVAYIVTDMHIVQWVDPSYHPTVGEAFKRLANDSQVLLFIALGAYLAYEIGRAHV